MSRRVGECIVIGDNIKVYVTLIDADQGKIRLAFDAPRDVTIMREELISPDPLPREPPCST